MVAGWHAYKRAAFALSSLTMLREAWAVGRALRQDIVRIARAVARHHGSPAAGSKVDAGVDIRPAADRTSAATGAATERRSGREEGGEHERSHGAIGGIRHLRVATEDRDQPWGGSVDLKEGEYPLHCAECGGGAGSAIARLGELLLANGGCTEIVSLI